MMYSRTLHSPAAPVSAPETTIFHRDGSRTVIGPMATIRYAPDGTATIVASALPEPTDHLRWDLAA